MSASPFQQPVDLVQDVRLRRAKDERGDPAIQLVFARPVSAGEAVEVESLEQLEFVYAWIGAAIASMRHLRWMKNPGVQL